MTRGVVAAGDPQTAEAGARALRAGGNAFDAAIAAAFAAFVCELPLCSPLGGGALVARRADGSLHALDLFARTPGLGGKPAELDFDHVVVDFGATTQVFHVGRGSAAVPLALPGLLEVHRRFGSLPLEALVEPAVELGRSGYELGPGVAYVFHLLAAIVCRTDACRRLFSAGGQIAAAGARLDNPDLAGTLERIARRPEVVRDLYHELARELGPEAGGLISERDVEAIAIEDRNPLVISHRGRQVVSMPAPSSGGALVLLGLRLAELDAGESFLSPEQVRRLVRVQESLLAVRGGELAERCREDEFVRRLVEQTIEPAAGTLLGSTTHISAIDEHGAAVALTLTNGEGCGVVLGDTGMVVNNLLGEEDIHPRGFHRDPPGTPLVTMMAPTLVSGDGELMALGSGGSNRLRNAILSVLGHLLDHGVDPRAAVEAPRLHVDLVADPPGRRLYFERPGMPEASLGLLRSVAGAVEFASLNMYFGGVHLAIQRGARFFGVGDPRRGGAAACSESPTSDHNVG
jgi:gamma-glutamyltranspeptidase / glutathione hydrolase